MLRQDSRIFDLVDINHEAMTRAAVTGVCILPLHQIPESKQNVHLPLASFFEVSLQNEAWFVTK